MPDITPIQAALADARTAVRQAEQTVTTLGGARASAARALELARRRGDATAVADAEAHLADLDEQITAAQGALGDARQQVGGLLTELHQTVDPAAQLAALSSDFPVALLPVRLETRYFGVVNDRHPELRVRIYPDDIHVDAHEPELTADELSWGQAFWRGTWRAGDDEPRARNVWGTLINQAGPNRAAWVAKATTPLNQTDAPDKAVPEDADLPVAPVFPDCALKGDSWTRPATARVLPDRWVAIAYRDGAKLGEWWSEPVADALPVSLDPDSPEPEKGTVPIDAGMRWMVDYEEAVKVGMGITIPLDYKNPLHIDQLLVLGVKTSADHFQGAELLGGLLDAHHYGNGLAVVRQGTPTNNSGEQDSGYAPRDRDPGPSFATERGGKLFTVDDGSDGDRLTRLLGIGRGVPEEEVFAHVENAGGTEFRDAGAMNAALWPATWGYFLDVMLEGAVSDETIADVRRHFVDHVRGAGPLAALRIGRQPYGVLPAVALSQLKPVMPREPLEQNLLTLLGKLRDMWRDALPKVPRVGRTDDIDADLVEVLGMDPQPLDYAVRGVTGPEFAIAVWDYMDVDVPQGWWDTVTDASLQATKKLGSNVLTPLSRAVFDDKETGLHRPLVVNRVSETEPLRGFGYLDALTTMTLQKIRDEDFSDFADAEKPASLLYVLLRHAILVAYTNAAKKIGKDEGAIPQQTPKEPELVNLDPQQPTLTVWNQLDQDILAGDGKNHSLADVVQVPALRTHYDTPELDDLLAAFAHLAGMPTAPLERALTQTLDLSTCRLDAWITSLATNKLENQRSSQPRGVFVGGFGYVENLRPDDPRQEVPAPPGETAPVFASDAPAGHVHAPSMAHAATAAVLRSAHLAHGGATGELLAVDLSSDRVRTAQWLIDGVREGQPLGALLGYRFERGLHDDALDVYIGPFRQLAPLVAGKLSEVDGPVEAVAARNVVDGLRLQRLWKEGGISFDAEGMPDEGTPEHQKVLNRLADLDAAADAVSDAVVAESVYQAVQGNLLRSGASLDAVAAGDVPPPELEVARTPRTGVGLTHRLVTMLDPAPEPVWAGAARTVAEPALDAWVGSLLGDPTRVLVRAVCTDTETGAVVLTPELSLDQLGLCPLDVVFATDGGADEQGGELARRFRHLAERTQLAGQPDTVTVSVDTGRQADWPLETLSLGEFAHLVRAVRRLVTQARPLTPKDLSLPTDNAAPAADVGNLAQRADAVRLALDTAVTTLTLLLAEEEPDANAVGDAILALGAFGVQGAVPTARTLEGLRADAAAALVDAHDRAARAAALAQVTPPDGVEAVEHHVARIRAVLGEEFPVLPRFPLAAADEFATAFADQDTLLAGEQDAPLLWLSRAARVRAGVGRFDEALRHAELLGAPEAVDLAVGQLPAGLGERWVGLPLDQGEQIAGGRVSLVVHHPRPVAPGDAVFGLLLDEWAEVVPNTEELTGVVFQHDAPGARAPQSILLAVAPGGSFTWSLGALEAAVLETIELAKLRAVDSVSLGEVGHYLPGLYFAFNVANDTISTSFLDLTSVEA
jgi:hypothetical protein